MSNHPFSRVLETYLRAKEAKGELLPGNKGRVNYKGVSTESGIAYGYFKKGTELRLVVDTWVEKLGASTEGRTQQPRRTREPGVRITVMTYAELKACGIIWLREHGYSEASVPSYLSRLNAYMRHFGRTDQDVTTDDFGPNFEQRLIAFLKATVKGKTVAAILRLWSRIHYEVRQSTSLPQSFGEALTGLVIDSGRSITNVARSAGCDRSTLWAWMLEDKNPINPVQIAKLETALDVLPGTLSTKLTFYGVRRSIDVPKEWWPAPWQKYYSNYRHHRTRVVALISGQLLSGSLEDLKPAFDKAVQEVLEGVGEPAHRRRSSKLTKKRYRILTKDWPDRPKEEFISLKEYRRAPSSFHNKSRGRRWAEGTIPIVQEYLEAFFGFLCLPADHPDPELRGLGMPCESLTLAWLVVPEVIERYLDFRCLRSGAHNGIVESFVQTWTAQLQPDSGWLWLHPELLERLPEQQQEAVTAAGGWKAYCANSLGDLKDSLALLRRNGEIRQTRDPMAPFLPILEHPEPLTLVGKALTRNRRDLEARGRANKQIDWKLAAGWRDHVLISFLARFPLRSKHWGLLTYREDGTGYLQNHHRDGWRLVIPHDDFKNVRNTKIFTLHSLERVLVLKFSKLKPLQQLIPLLEFYLEHVRPVLAGQSDFLFPSARGKAIGRDLIYRQVSIWTREYLSQHSPRKLGIKDVFPFGPHAFRDIVATHIIKTTGSIALAANILLDSEEMVRKHYARFLPEDRVGLAMAGLAAAFDMEDEED